MDRWPSGLRRSPAKGVRGKLLRGFESHPVRHDTKHLQKLTLLYSVNLKQTFYLSDLAREYKYKVEKFSITKIWSELLDKDKLNGFESFNKFYHLSNLETFKKLKDL